MSHYDLHNESFSVKWSILICTLENRALTFERLYKKLQDQINKLNLSDSVEIVFFKDNREHSVGYKRNKLLENSHGEYICFVDDDDDVSDDYIKIIYEKLLKNPDCVSLVGIITVCGTNPRKFIHSIKYDSWFEKNTTYYRCPNHLNPIRRDIAIQFKFPEKNFQEDLDWSMQIARSGLLKYEEEITKPYYFYLFDPFKKNDKKK